LLIFVELNIKIFLIVNSRDHHTDVHHHDIGILGMVFHCTTFILNFNKYPAPMTLF